MLGDLRDPEFLPRLLPLATGRFIPGKRPHIPKSSLLSANGGALDGAGQLLLTQSCWVDDDA